jgi:hypothetical protein
MTVVNEISKYKLDLVGVEEVRWNREGTEPAGELHFFYVYIRESYQHLRGYNLLVMLYKMLRGRYCDITVLNVYAPTEDKIEDMKDGLYKN